MKILMIAFNLMYQGTFWRAYNLGRGLAKTGNEITLIATSRKSQKGIKEYEQEGVRIVEMPDLFHNSLRSGWDPWNVINRVQWLKGKEFDLVHAFESRPTVIYPALAYLRQQPVPLVMDWADWFGKGGSVEERPSWLVKTVLRPVETYFEVSFRKRAHGTTVICSTLREKALALGVPQDSILYLTNGANTETLLPKPIEAARQSLSIAPDEMLIGYAGSIFKRDARLMAAAFERVVQQRPQAKLVLAGNFPYDFKAMVSCPQNVIQTGFVDTQVLADYLSACDIFWLPLSDSNANRGRFPYKFTDYMTIGRPIVATAVGDLPAMFRDQSIGFITPDQPEEIAQKTIRLMDDPALRVQFGKAARRLAESDFSWDELSRQLEGHYRKVMLNFQSKRSTSSAR